MIATFLLKPPEQGEVSRRTAYIRNNGLLDDVPSFTILSNRCVHLGCPVQVNGPDRRRARRSEPRTTWSRGSRPPPPPASAARATAASTTPRATAPPARPSARSTATSSRSTTAACSSARPTRVSEVDGDGSRRADPCVSTHRPRPARRRPSRPALPGPAAPLMAKRRSRAASTSSCTILLYPLDWLEERSGPSSAASSTSSSARSRRHQLGAHARLGDADRVHRPGGHRRDPRHVLQADPD